MQANVGRSLHNLKIAGIRTWVLTGDKTDTAIQIGFACNLLKPNQKIHEVHAKDELGLARNGAQVTELLSKFAEEDRKYAYDDPALVIEGDAMRALGIGGDLPSDLSPHALAEELAKREKWQKEFTAFCASLSAVICCRVGLLG